MSTWQPSTFQREQDRAFNLAALSASGWAPDEGRTLTAEEIARLELTPMETIPHREIVGQYYWNRGGRVR